MVIVHNVVCWEKRVIFLPYAKTRRSEGCYIQSVSALISVFLDKDIYKCGCGKSEEM